MTVAVPPAGPRVRHALLAWCLAATTVFASTAACAIDEPIRGTQFVEAIPAMAEPDRTLIFEHVKGEGLPARAGRFVVIHYEGFVHDPAAPQGHGIKFDSTFDHGHPLSVLVGVGRMIPGLDKGIVNMKVGSKRTLLVPPKMGYGSRLAYGEVPPNSTLIFEVELLDVVPQANVN
jgi:FKBP-type peptidyl-prolyl cis-trans isomerase FkpA